MTIRSQAEPLAPQCPGWHSWTDNRGYHARRDGDGRHAYLTAGDPRTLLAMIGIARDFPGWQPGQSPGGRWQAARTGTRPPGPPEGFAMTVDGADAGELREAISRQERLAAPQPRQ
jgi:hypothetical protein